MFLLTSMSMYNLVFLFQHIILQTLNVCSDIVVERSSFDRRSFTGLVPPLVTHLYQCP